MAASDNPPSQGTSGKNKNKSKFSYRDELEMTIRTDIALALIEIKGGDNDASALIKEAQTIMDFVLGKLEAK